MMVILVIFILTGCFLLGVLNPSEALKLDRKVPGLRSFPDCTLRRRDHYEYDDDNGARFHNKQS